MNAATPSRRRLFAFGALAAAGSFLLAFFLLEVGLRVRDHFDPTFDKWTSLNSRWIQPFVGMGDFRDSQRSSGTPGEFGYERKGPMFVYWPREPVASLADRGTFLYPSQVEEARTWSHRRIFILGGSAALGDGAFDPANRFGNQIQKKLRAACKADDIDVVTAAIRSFVTSQERVAFELYVLPLRPDAAIFLDGFNDADQLNSATRPGDPYNQGVLYARNESRLFRGFEFFGNFFRVVEYLGFHWSMKEVDRRRWKIFYDPELSATFYASVGAIYEDNLRHLSRRCEQEGVPCYVFLQPAKETGTLLPYWRGYQSILSARAAGKPLPKRMHFLDLSHSFDGRGELFTDAVHLNDEGQGLLTDTVVRRLTDGGFCRSSARGLRGETP